MYRSFAARNFRCFRDVKVDGLERVNLIAGVNNVGKTALLEALFLHCGAYNPELALRVNAWRGVESVDLRVGAGGEAPWDSLFSDFNTSASVELEGTDERNGRRVVSLRAVDEPAELRKIGFTRSQGSAGETPTPPGDAAPPSTEAARVLEWRHREGGRDTICHLIIDRQGVRMEPFPPPPFPAIFVGAQSRVALAEDAERFSDLEGRGLQDVVLTALKVIEPRLVRLAVGVVAGAPMIRADVGTGRLMPLALTGGGMTRMASLVLAIGKAAGGVVLVDEAENGFHHSVLGDVWRAIGQAARQFDTQVFATTHSFECVSAAHHAFADNPPYDFRLHRLERPDGGVRAVTYDEESLAGALSMGLEVR